MSIGDALAEGRRQSGLTITQVSQRTCIRETIIRGIERGDFSACGGDFYARGHIRSIARVVGVDPEPLVEEYDATMGEPQTISAADVFQPVTPVKLKERRRPNWTAALAVFLVLVVGVLAYQHFLAHPAKATSSARSTSQQNASAVSKAKVKATVSPTATPTKKKRRLAISVTAKQNCWVQITTVAGQTLFSGVVYAGSSMHWIEHRAVSMVIGNPAGVKVAVNGKNPVPAGSVSAVTLSLHLPKG